MNCHCRCRGKCGMLGPLEQKIMEILWSSKTPLKPSQVLAKLSQPSAYTTVMTVLKRMVDKKILTRHLQKRVYFYQAAQTKSGFAKKILDRLFHRLFLSYGRQVITSFRRAAKLHGFTIY